MADHEQPDRDQPPAGPPAIRPPGQPPAVPMPDDEQWRQFQEFQRFQDFQRGQADGTLPPPPRAKRRPLWLRVLLAKWFRRLVYLLLVLLALTWAYQHFFGGPDEDLPASQTGGGKTTRTVLFATTPKEAVRAFYDNIAQNIPDDACTRFETQQVEDQFARHFNAPDCRTAVQRLNAEVGTANEYAEPRFPLAMDFTPRTDGTIVVSSCEMEVYDGPRLGRFTVKVIPGSRGDQWTISRHDDEPNPCPAKATQPTG
ncbi:hypothetical protein [Actinokineospora diospyrosa]|nr:hypothetical protein [Actinokineospora diospyrosa]